MHRQITQFDIQQSDVLKVFYVFITEVVTSFQSAFSKMTDATSVPFVDRFDALNMWPKQRCVCPIIPDFTPELIKCMSFTETYTRRLVMWLCRLQWAPQKSQEDPGITYLELFLDFYLATNSLPPLNVACSSNTNPEYKLVGEGRPDPSLALKPRLMHQTLRVFEFSLKYVSKLFGGHLIPVEYCGQTFCLSHLGVKGVRGGMTVRPAILHSDEVLTLISRTAHDTTKHFSIDSIQLPTSRPSIDVSYRDSDFSRTGTSYMHFKRFLRQ